MLEMFLNGNHLEKLIGALVIKLWPLPRYFLKSTTSNISGLKHCSSWSELKISILFSEICLRSFFAMDFGDVDACPGLNLKHGFLRSINQRLTLSHDNMVQEKEQIKQEKANMKEVEDKTKKKKPRRPTIELYSIPGGTLNVSLILNLIWICTYAREI